TAGRHHRRDRGRRSVEAHRRRRRIARRPLAYARRAVDALARSARAARPRLPRLRQRTLNDPLPAVRVRETVGAIPMPADATSRMTLPLPRAGEGWGEG